MNEKQITCLLDILKERYPSVATQLVHKNAFELLMATILSAQCTDRQVNKVTRILFEKFPDPESLSAASLDELKSIVFSTGFYNNKALHLKECATALCRDYKNSVPEDMESLLTLPGVGRKTANLIRSVWYKKDTIVVDTHVKRLSNRLGLVCTKDPFKIEKQLMQKIPKTNWNDFCLQLMNLGREFCLAQNPECPCCPCLKICPQNIQDPG